MYLLQAQIITINYSDLFLITYYVNKNIDLSIIENIMTKVMKGGYNKNIINIFTELKMYCHVQFIFKIMFLK